MAPAPDVSLVSARMQEWRSPRLQSTLPFPFQDKREIFKISNFLALHGPSVNGLIKVSGKVFVISLQCACRDTRSDYIMNGNEQVKGNSFIEYRREQFR